MNPQKLQDGQGGPLPPNQNNQLSQQNSNPQQPYGGQPQVPAQAFPAPPASPALDSTPYDFILNPQQQSKKPLVAIKGGSMVKRVVVAVGALAILIIIAVIITSVIGGGGGGNKVPMITVAQEQTELIRIASQGAQRGIAQKTQNVAYNVQLSVESANNQLLAYLKQNHIKVAPKTLALKHNKQADTALTNALANSTFDITFNTLLQADLASYVHSLQAAYTANPGAKGKALLNSQFQAANLLVEQSKL